LIERKTGAMALRLGLWLLDDCVQRQLLYLTALQELLGAVTAVVFGSLRGEDDVYTGDVLGYVEL
jgi:hypothetical protein